MIEKIKEILSKYTKEEIAAESTLVNDLGLSSFDIVSIVTAFEDEFDIEISDRDIRKLVSVADIMEYIENNWAKGQVYAWINKTTKTYLWYGKVCRR